jgi:hypothetical protein
MKLLSAISHLESALLFWISTIFWVSILALFLAVFLTDFGGDTPNHLAT